MKVSQEFRQISIIILAAGSSSRMGSAKQLLKVDNEFMLTRAAKEAIRADLGSVIVVLGSHEAAVREALTALPVAVIVNAHWDKGMGTSIKAGVQYISAALPATDGILIMVCDQPYVDALYLKQIANEHLRSEKPITASYYNGVAGVPALFNQQYFSALRNLPDTQGAKKIIQQNIQQAALIDFPEGAIDLDTPEDFDSFVKRRRES